MYNIANLIVRESAYRHKNLAYTFKKIEDNSLFDLLIEDDEFLERLMISSENLYRAIIKAKEKGDYPLHMVNSVYKYYLRMSTRAIPFGLNSSIGYVDTNEKLHKIVRPSNIWLNELRKKIESRIEITSLIKVQLNNMVRIKKLHIELDTINESKNIIKKIRKNKLIEYLLNQCKTPVYIETLIKQLSEKFAGVSKGELLHFIKNLIDINILVTNIKPHTYNFGKSCLNLMIDSTDESIKKKLLYIRNLIDEYEMSRVGQAINLYEKMIIEMRKVCYAKEYIVVDLIGNESINPTEVNENSIKEFIDNIQVFNQHQIFDPRYIMFEHFKIKFLARYGQFNEVSLIEVINKDKGIGLPNENLGSTFYKLQSKIDKIKAKQEMFIFNKWLRSDVLKEEVIVLSDDDISEMNNYINYELTTQANIGYDIKFNMYRNNGSEKYILTNSSISSSPYVFAGRFNLKKNNIINNEGYNQAAICTLPFNYPDLGISFNKVISNIEIDCLSEDEGSININDIVMGFKEGNLYLKSKKTQQIIVPIRTNLLYYNNFNELRITHFLNLFAEVMSCHPRELNFSHLNNLVCLPRIEYKNIVFHTKKWQISKSNIVGSNKDVSRKELREYLSKINVEKIVNLIVGDMNITLFTENSFSLDIIIEEINKQEIVTLSEVIGANDTIGRDYILTIPEFKHDFIENGNIQNENDNNKYDISYHYYKIYYEKYNKDIVTKLIRELLVSTKSKEYFIVYYSDEKEHIRVRFKGKDTSVHNLETSLNSLIDSEDIIDYSKNLFFPEKERYGGEKIYKEIYKYFYLDTDYYFNLLDDNEYKKFSVEEKGIFVVINTLLDFFPNYKNALEFIKLCNNDTDKASLYKFKKNRNRYKNNVKILLEKYRDKYNGYEKRKQGKAIESIIELFRMGDERKEYIYQSIIHMAINRHFYVERSIENEMLSLSGYCLYNFKYLMEIEGRYGELQ
ncbi:hypothetical protein AJ85_21630 [Alkalihalobacillus alcalophilus ATCC 27647 = CGMCC 1.3604]|uniref:Lantibiotic dehydratase n=1 Tax=Alkalihalobacillus alcalophilus ATCC 27647 = CGMCC 1.3604 TaxID=1218173 RepID=A0A094YT16_ALKAL|nr:thiopeptide-type bacteriocin biosynthesis protein [Alkalihalobacillus alcalophilus]KGA96627.1 hypothetical protein BALCAV_0214995 [Alkalihalobacillus alcalophilus ATCC 27647 = CGMCC 1.3604]MED1563614.1 thiopeptide-type bacteriocin biosynthesis protein [Alkalihalobacillus alcalophilus]THG91990.1 hypothetical protein AJ85_21630 [Alkalihalobacillus alcalophilus ATCC 27647 = CGMCC 1.3604]